MNDIEPATTGSSKKKKKRKKKKTGGPSAEATGTIEHVLCMLKFKPCTRKFQISSKLIHASKFQIFPVRYKYISVISNAAYTMYNVHVLHTCTSV